MYVPALVGVWGGAREAGGGTGGSGQAIGRRRRGRHAAARTHEPRGKVKGYQRGGTRLAGGG